MINRNRSGERQERTAISRLRVVSYLYRWSLILTLGLFGCAFPGKRREIPQIKLTLQNTLPIQRKSVPIVFTFDELRKVAPDFSFDAYLVVSGQPPAEIPSQADDINYDGQKDELVFLVDFAPQETKEVSIRYSPNNPMPVTLGFTRRTRAGIFPELNGLAALESNLAAYLLKPNGFIQVYGKKGKLLFSIESKFQSDLADQIPISVDLQQVFKKNNSPLSQNVTIETQKPDSSWLITDSDNKQKYFVRKEGKQLNVYKAKALSIDLLTHQIVTHADANEESMVPLLPMDSPMGCGGFALWDEADQRLITPPDANSYVRVIADGPIRSTVQQITPNWQLKTGEIQSTSTFSIYAGNRWIEHRINVEGLPADYRVATGIPVLGAQPVKDKENGWLWTWGKLNTTSPSTQLGMGVIYSVDQFDAFQDLASQKPEASVSMVLMRPNERGDVVYRSFAVWGGEVDAPQAKEEFDQYVQITATKLHTPPVIQFLPQTPPKEQDKGK